MRRPSLLALLLLCALALVHAAWRSTALPAVVASHFDAAGHANAWMSRAGFIIGVMHLAGAANLDGTGDLGKGGLWLVAAFVVYTLAMLARMALRFSGPG